MIRRIATMMIVIVCVLILGLCASSVHAETFDIGEKDKQIGETDAYGRTVVQYDSGITIGCMDDFADDIPSILDGDKSTGISISGSTHRAIEFYVVWNDGLNITSINILNSFGSGKSSYELVIFVNPHTYLEYSDTSVSKEFKLNFTIWGLRLIIWETPIDSGSGNFYFNDVIIKYSPGTEQSPLSETIFQLETEIAKQSVEIDDLKTENAKLQEDVNSLKAGSGEEDEDGDSDMTIYILAFMGFGMGFFGAFFGLIAFFRKPRTGLFHDERVERERGSKK